MKTVITFLLFFIPVMAICQGELSAGKMINCSYIYFDEVNSKYSDTIHMTVRIEELTQFPPPSKTIVNYIEDYETKKDSLGRVYKLIRTNHNDGTTEETTYIYDSENRVIREDITSDNRFSGRETYLYLNEQVNYTYLDGKVVEKIRSTLSGATNQFVTEKWIFSY